MWAAETTIASWNKQALAKNTAVNANDGDANNKGKATLTSSVALSTAGTNAYYASSGGNTELVFANLVMSSYSDIKMTFYSRGSATGTITVSTSTNGSSYTTLTTTSNVTKSEKQYTVSSIPNTAKYIKLKYNGTSGSFYFGTPVIKGTAIPAKAITATSNNNEYGTVSLSGSEIVATPKTGYRISKTTPYTIISGTATITQDENRFFVTPETDCEIKINFEAIPTHAVTFYVNGAIYNTSEVAEDASITFPVSTPSDLATYKFVGWTLSEIVGSTDEAPTFATSGVMAETDINYYAVYATAAVGPDEEVKTQTLEFDTWTYGGGTSTKVTVSAGNYRLFGNGAYVESAPFDLSTLSKVIVYGGYYGGSSYSKLNIGDGTNTWKDVEVSGNDQTAANTFTDGTALSGIGKLYITSKSGTGESGVSGVRMSKIEIFCMLPSVAYSGYRTSIVETKTVGESEWATWVATAPVEVPSGVEAYMVKTTSLTSVSLVEVSTIPANTPVILKNIGTHTFRVCADADIIDDLSDNKLLISDGTSAVGDDIFVLAKRNGKVGFYRWISPSSLTAGKVYLKIAGGSAREFIGFGDDETTGIESLTPALSEGEGAIYNLNGQQVKAAKKGLYIVNGKKVIIK